MSCQGRSQPAGLGRTVGNYAKCMLAVDKGEVAAELLGRLEDIDSLRVAALLIRETGRVGGGVVKRTVSHRLFV